MQQWQTGFCFGSDSVEVQYNGSLNESEARSYFQSGIDDIAFTTQPLTGAAKTKYTYAPVAISATNAGYWVDNTEHRPAVHQHQAGRPAACQDADHLLLVHERLVSQRRQLRLRLRQRGGQ